MNELLADYDKYENNHALYETHARYSAAVEAARARGKDGKIDMDTRKKLTHKFMASGILDVSFTYVEYCFYDTTLKDFVIEAKKKHCTQPDGGAKSASKRAAQAQADPAAEGSTPAKKAKPEGDELAPPAEARKVVAVAREPRQGEDLTGKVVHVWWAGKLYCGCTCEKDEGEKLVIRHRGSGTEWSADREEIETVLD